MPSSRPLKRRHFLRLTAAGSLGVFVAGTAGARLISATPVAGGTLDAASIPKWAMPLVVPARMPRSGVTRQNGREVDLYDIAVRRVQQQILPAGLPTTAVFAYGPVATALKGAPRDFRFPSMTIEATRGRPVQVRWRNQLVDGSGGYLAHLLAVDPTLHWANPGGGVDGRDTRPLFMSTPPRYEGPVPTVTHVHGATNVGDESDGYSETWVLPAANDIPASFARNGRWHDFFAQKARMKFGATWPVDGVVSQYPNPDRACANWYHDHTLGMTRLNVYAGMAGFYLVRGGSQGDAGVRDSMKRRTAQLPSPAPDESDYRTPRRFREIPLVIADRSFNTDGSLFYPDSRAFFDDAPGPYVPDGDLAPIWNPEFFGNTITVNGNTWPQADVERRRYRTRVLNACGSRYLILDFTSIPGVTVHQIGNDGGFLAAPLDLGGRQGRLLLAPSERADLIIDFTAVTPGSYVLRNVGPDEPYGGGEPGVDFVSADPDSTGQVLRLTVGAAVSVDTSTPASRLQLPSPTPLPAATVTRRLAMLENMSMTYDGPSGALLGVVEGDPATGPAKVSGTMWGDPVTENPTPGVAEHWDVYNTTEDAHPVHIHESKFEVVARQAIRVTETMVPDVVRTVEIAPGSTPRPPEPGETNLKDTVIVYPGEMIRLKVRFLTPGQYVWHCHIIEHEDNEMMRPFRIGPVQVGQPVQPPMGTPMVM